MSNDIVDRSLLLGHNHDRYEKFWRGLADTRVAAASTDYATPLLFRDCYLGLIKTKHGEVFLFLDQDLTVVALGTGDDVLRGLGFQIWHRFALLIRWGKDGVPYGFGFPRPVICDKEIRESRVNTRGLLGLSYGTIYGLKIADIAEQVSA